MKKDSAIIAALSVGIVVVIGVTAAVMYQSSQKLTQNTAAAETTAAVQTTGSASTAAASETTAATSSAAASSAAATVKTSVTAAPSPTSTPSPSPSPTAAPSPAIADGSYNVYISAVSAAAPNAGSQGTITVRIAKIYSGAEAIAQAKADGHADFIEIDEDGKEYIPNDYYISDTSKASLVLPVGKSCSIRVIPADGPVTTSDDYCVDGTLQNLSDDTAEYERFATITVTGGSVSMIGEFYLP